MNVSKKTDLIYAIIKSLDKERLIFVGRFVAFAHPKSKQMEKFLTTVVKMGKKWNPEEAFDEDALKAQIDDESFSLNFSNNKSKLKQTVMDGLRLYLSQNPQGPKHVIDVHNGMLDVILLRLLGFDAASLSEIETIEKRAKAEEMTYMLPHILNYKKVRLGSIPTRDEATYRQLEENYLSTLSTARLIENNTVFGNFHLMVLHYIEMKDKRADYANELKEKYLIVPDQSAPRYSYQANVDYYLSLSLYYFHISKTYEDVVRVNLEFADFMKQHQSSHQYDQYQFAINLQITSAYLALGNAANSARHLVIISELPILKRQDLVGWDSYLRYLRLKLEHSRSFDTEPAKIAGDTKALHTHFRQMYVDRIHHLTYRIYLPALAEGYFLGGEYEMCYDLIYDKKVDKNLFTAEIVLIYTYCIFILFDATFFDRHFQNLKRSWKALEMDNAENKDITAEILKLLAQVKQHQSILSRTELQNKFSVIEGHILKIEPDYAMLPHKTFEAFKKNLLSKQKV